MAKEQIINGKLLHVGEPKHFGENNESYTTKFYVEVYYDSDYPSQVEFTVWKDKVDLSKFKAGDELEIKFSFRGEKRTWEDKKTKKKKSAFFQEVQAWSVSSLSQGEPTEINNSQNTEEDDLPF